MPRRPLFIVRRLGLVYPDFIWAIKLDFRVETYGKSSMDDEDDEHSPWGRVDEDGSLKIWSWVVGWGELRIWWRGALLFFLSCKWRGDGNEKRERSKGVLIRELKWWWVLEWGKWFDKAWEKLRWLLSSKKKREGIKPGIISGFQYNEQIKTQSRKEPVRCSRN